MAVRARLVICYLASACVPLCPCFLVAVAVGVGSTDAGVEVGAGVLVAVGGTEVGAGVLVAVGVAVDEPDNCQERWAEPKPVVL